MAKYYQYQGMYYSSIWWWWKMVNVMWCNQLKYNIHNQVINIFFVTAASINNYLHVTFKLFFTSGHAGVFPNHFICPLRNQLCYSVIRHVCRLCYLLVFHKKQNILTPVFHRIGYIRFSFHNIPKLCSVTPV